MYLIRLYISTPESPAWISFSLTLTTILLASILSIEPPLEAVTQDPESLATSLSTPVPTSGFSACSVGTACLIMFEPINALLASSCSKKGINEAATEKAC